MIKDLICSHCNETFPNSADGFIAKTFHEMMIHELMNKQA